MSEPKPEPPRHLSVEARVLWRHFHDQYDFEPWETKTLRLALDALDRASAARRAIRRYGLTYQDRFGAPHARPEVAIERDARQAWIRLMTALDLPTEEEPSAQVRTIRGTFGPRTPRGQGRVARAKAAS